MAELEMDRWKPASADALAEALSAGDYDAAKAAHVACLQEEITYLRESLRGAVSLTYAEWERVLWWLHKPVPPGPAKALDESIIRKIHHQRGGGAE